jgi:opacity protein-like surface antigen/outer membrane protease
VKTFLLGSVSLVILTSALEAQAADVLVKAAPAPAAYNWSGFYTGLNVGAMWGSFDPNTSSVAGTYIPNPADVAAINAAGVQSINPLGFTGGSQAGYNLQWGNWVAGIEADFNYVHLNGAASSGAVAFPAGGSGFGFLLPGGGFAPLNQFVISSYSHADWLATVRPRLGFAQNNWLFYATGGLALTQLNGDLLFTDGAAGIGAGAIQSARINNLFKAGYAVGGGVEWGVTNRLSLKAEYLYVNFGNEIAGETSNNIPSFASPLFQTFRQSSDLTANIVRLGFNYKLGGADPDWSAVATTMPLKAPKVWPKAAEKSNWEIDIGGRTWFSTGTVGAPQPLLNNPQILASRLFYDDLNAISGETYARVDHASGWFAKGFLGAGSINKGNLHDEDFPADLAYSNTLSSASGSLAYANIDLGYTFLQAPGAKVGAFVGYNYFTQHINTYSCIQTAGDDTCAAGTFPPNFLGIAEQERFDSLRIGLTTQFMLTDRLRLTAEAAYLPWTSFSAQDDHNARELLLPEHSGGGNGVMLEALLDYRVTDHWNVGVGGRYWAWNMRTGTTTFNNLGLAAPPFDEPARFSNERYGAFIQTSYHWGDTTASAVSAAAMPVKAPVAALAPTNWTGIYVGGHLGGGFSDEHWSDPFPTAPSGFGLNNFAGFGDTIHSMGPLAGGQIGADWQTGHWVLGVRGDADWSSIRGENSCFTGTGGMNCENFNSWLSTVVGRVGYAWDRAMVYGLAGGAWAGTTYHVNGNTFVLALGEGSTSITRSGWVAGVGVQYALTDRWSTLFEYDHIDTGSAAVPFPTVAVVNAQNISVKQTMDLFKVGVNYKLY